MVGRQRSLQLPVEPPFVWQLGRPGLLPAEALEAEGLRLPAMMSAWKIGKYIYVQC